MNDRRQRAAASPRRPRRLVLVLCLTGALVAGGGGPAAGSASEGEPAPTSVLVRFHEEVAAEDAHPVLDDAGVGGQARLRELGVFELEVPARRVGAVVDQLSAMPLVDYAEPNLVVRLLAVEPNDPLWAEQWNARQVNAPLAWGLTIGSSDVVVAVLDTGVDRHHRDLAGAFVAGYNALTGSRDADDDHGHGTQVAGLIAARGNNGRGVAGMCWRCRIMPVKVLDSAGFGDVASVAEGVVWAANRGASIINLSLGSPIPSSTLADALAYARSRGVIVVAAAGNEGVSTRTYPAAHDSVIGVGATDERDRRYPWSNHGSWISVAAPGCAVSTERGDAYNALCGTSVAAPHVAGIIGLAQGTFGRVPLQGMVHALEASGPGLTWVRGGRVDAVETLRRLALAGGATPLVGDWNGDGRPTPGWYMNGQVYLRNANSAGSTDVAFSYGRRGDVPVVGDWNGDGRDTIGVVRDRTWLLRFTNTSGPADRSFVYGRLTDGDRPLAGDWNGDGRDTPGIVRSGEWHLRNRLAGGPADRVFVYGRVRSGDRPIVGDWNGDGLDTAGIVRAGEWHLRHTNRGGVADRVFLYGRAGDRPVVGDWNRDRVATPGVVRGATWHPRDRNSSGPADHRFGY